MNKLHKLARSILVEIQGATAAGMARIELCPEIATRDFGKETSDDVQVIPAQPLSVCG